MLYIDILIIFILFFQGDNSSREDIILCLLKSKCALMGHVVVGEKALRQFHSQNDAQDDGQGDFAGHPTAL